MIGLISDFFLQFTFFTALLTVDIQRVGVSCYASFFIYCKANVYLYLYSTLIVTEQSVFVLYYVVQT